MMGYSVSVMVRCLSMHPVFHEFAELFVVDVFSEFVVFSFVVLLAVISCHSGAGCGSVLVLRHCVVVK